ncbi:MAG TPA: ABC transporter ATP-binding protein [Thermotoga naphthophila]|nr:ABC transporter ATP-binding protein [Thermotoga petrophila]
MEEVEVILRVEGLRKDFNGMKVIENWSFSVGKGDRVTLLGPSGCGKTTFLRIVSGLEDFQGKVEVFTDKIGYVFQEPRLIPWKTITENLMLIRRDPDKMASLLEKVELKGFENHYPWQLSEGMKQRVNFVRALLVDPELLLLDEPFDALDLKTKMRVMNMLIDLWQKRRFSIVFVTHNVKEAVFLSERIFLLSGRPSKILDEVKLKEKAGDFTDDKLFGLEKMVIERLLSLLR